MLHFCFFSFEISPFTPGGVGTYITSIAIRLSSLGNKVTIVLDIDKNTFQRVKESSSCQSIDSNRIEFLLLSDLISEDELSRDQFPSDAHWKSYQFMVAAELVHSHDKVDVLEFVDYCGAAYYSLLRRSEAPEKLPRHILIRLHNTIELITKCSSFSFYNSRVFDFWLERASIALADRILSPGIRYLNELVNPLYDIPENRVIISPLCRQLLPRVCDGVSGKNIVFFGRVSTYKGLDIFLQAMAMLCADSSISALFNQIRIIGPKEGITLEDEEAILNYAKNIPDDKIQFLGNLNENDLIEESFGAMFAVFPNRCESFGYAAHEAHMMGVPLILSATPAFMDHFSDGESALFFDQTPQNLISKIREIILDSTLRQKLSDSVLLHRDRYNSVKFGPEIDEYLNIPKKFDSISHYEAIPTPIQYEMNLTIILFCHASYRSKSHKFIEPLIKNNDGIDFVILYESGKEGVLNAFGKSWDFDSAVKVDKDFLENDLVLIMSDENLIQPSFINRVKKMMSRLPMVGAVLPTEFKADISDSKFGRAAELFFLRGGYISESFPLLIRLTKDTTFIHLFRDSSPCTVLTLLMECRASDRVIIDDAHPSFTRSLVEYPLFGTPDKQDLSIFVKKNITLFLDFELGTFLFDSINEESALEWVGKKTPQIMRRVYRDLQLGNDNGLYIYAINGSIEIFSVIDTVLHQELDWNCFHIDGTYSNSYHKDRSEGSLVLNEGACLYVENGNGMVFNIALGPTFEVFAMVANNRGLLVDIKHHEFDSCSFVPNVLFDVVGKTAYEIPDRSYCLNSYRKSLHRHDNFFGNSDANEYIKPKYFFDDGNFDEFLTGVYPHIHVIPLDRHDRNVESIADEIVAHAYYLGNKTACFYGIEWIDVITRLLEDFDYMFVEVALSPLVIWNSNNALKYISFVKQVSHFRSRVIINGPYTHQGYFPSCIEFIPYSLNINKNKDVCSFKAFDKYNSVHIIIDNNLRGEVYMGHVAAVVKLLHFNGVVIDCISVPSNCPPQDRLFESFGLIHLLRYYKQIDEYTAIHDKLIIYLNPFPFGENIGNLSTAIEQRWLTVISYYEAALFDLPECDYIHVVAYWEDVELISQLLLESIDQKIIGRMGLLS